MLKYLWRIWRIIVYIIILVSLVVLFSLEIGDSFKLSFDPIPLIIMLLIPFSFQCLLYEEFAYKTFYILFSNKNNIYELKKIKYYFKVYEKLLWTTAIIAVIILLHLSKYLEKDNIENIFNLRMNLIIQFLFWTSIINLLIIIPIKILIKDKILITKNKINLEA